MRVMPWRYQIAGQFFLGLNFGEIEFINAESVDVKIFGLDGVALQQRFNLADLGACEDPKPRDGAVPRWREKVALPLFGAAIFASILAALTPLVLLCACGVRRRNRSKKREGKNA